MPTLKVLSDPAICTGGCAPSAVSGLRMWILDALYSALWPPTSQVLPDPRAQDVAVDEGFSSHSNDKTRVVWRSGLSVLKRDAEPSLVQIKDCFEQGKMEISKAVRAEEWGMPEEAVEHYRTASKILCRGLAMPSGSPQSRGLIISRLLLVRLLLLLKVDRLFAQSIIGMLHDIFNRLC